VVRCERCGKVRERPGEPWRDHPAKIPGEVLGFCKLCGDLLRLLGERKWRQQGRQLLRDRARGYGHLTPIADVFAGMREGEKMSETAVAVIEPDRERAVTVQAVDEAKDFGGYAGVATVSLTTEQAKDLGEELPDEAHDILPTGEVYVSQVHYRRLLNRVFGPGGWALVPRGPFAMQGNTITREYALVGPGGRFISEAIGETEYQPNNARMSYASACEAAKSNALTRCCKDLGIASECWDRRWCDRWIAKHAVKVWRKGVTKPQWRRRDATPWYDESGEAKPHEAPRPAPTVTREQEVGADAYEGEAPPSQTPACAHCGSVNVQPDPKAKGWLMCGDCKKGTRVKAA
jgi:hypothetical protein